jgi:hypothetical protein
VNLDHGETVPGGTGWRSRQPAVFNAWTSSSTGRNVSPAIARWA